MKDQKLQTIKGIAILMVVVHHAISMNGYGDANLIVRLLNRVHVSLFFIVSGWLFQLNAARYKKLGAGRFIGKKCLELGVPYLVWSTLIHLVVVLLSVVPALHNIYEKLGYQAKGPLEFLVSTVTFNDCYVQIMWFIYTLMILYVINYFVDGRWVTPLTVVAAIVVSVVLRAAWKDMPYLVYKLLRHAPGFLFGRLLVRQKREDRPFDLRLILPMAAVQAICLVPEIIGGEYAALPYITGLSEMLTGLLAFVLLYMVLTPAEGWGGLAPLNLLGGHSMPIYLIHHTYIIGPIAVLGKMAGIAPIILVFACIVCGLLIPLLVEWVVKKCPGFVGRVLFGRA